MDLQQYDQMKSALAEILRGVTLRNLEDGGKETVRDLFARLAEDRFNLVVVGRFSRGKTSLMNAMLGTDRLPVGVVPVTSVITTVSYGSEEKAVLFYQHTRLFLDIPLKELADHITEQGNPGNRRRIRMAEVQLPAELLRRGFYFIDTPGLGSSIMENTRTTEAFLPEADAFVLVTSYDSPLSEEEQRILQMIQRSNRCVFVILNKQDCVDAMQRAQVREHLRTQLTSVFGNEIPPVFSISARQGLEARLRGDAAKFAASGLPIFEATLLGFLINEKRREFLLRMCDRIEAILAPQIGTQQDSARLDALRAEVDAIQSVMAPAPTVSVAGTAISPALPACEICSGINETTFNFLAKYQYQLHGNRAALTDLAERRGLCSPHTSFFEAVAAPMEICTGFAGVAERQAAYLRAAAQRQPNGMLACRAVEDALPTAETCPACQVAKDVTDQTVRRIADRLTRDDSALRNLSAICLSHLHLLLSLIESPAIATAVLQREADVLERLAEDMRHFALKRAGMQQHLASKEEESAGVRALRILVGHPRAQTGVSAARMRGNVTPLTRQAS